MSSFLMAYQLYIRADKLRNDDAYKNKLVTTIAIARHILPSRSIEEKKVKRRAHLILHLLLPFVLFDFSVN